MVRIASFAIIAILASIATSAELIDSVASVHVGSSRGSGTYIGGRLVLTAAHVPRGENPDSVMVHFRDGVAYHGRVVGSDPSWDQAVIQLTSTPNAQPIQIAHTNPKPGDVLWVAGFGDGDRIFIRQTRCVRYAANSTSATSADWIVSQGPVVPGTSGGPVFDQHGRLVGNVWGSDASSFTAVSTGRTQRFLFPWNAQLRAVQLAQCRPLRRCPPPRQIYRIQPPQQRIIVPQSPVAEPPQVSLPPTSTPEIDYDRLADILADKLKDDPAFRGPAGPAGETGPPGADGKPGMDGKPGPTNVEQLTLITSSLEQLTQRLRSLETSTFDVTVVNRATKTTQTGKVNPHGGSLEITLDPVPVQGR